MKVIDLYIKHANGEDLPEKIEIGNNVFELNETSDIYYTGVYNDIPLSMEWDLNDEVKIIEEGKEIEKLDKVDGSELVDLHKNSTCKEQNEAITNLIMYLNNNIVKINELIDAVNEIRKEK